MCDFVHIPKHSFYQQISFFTRAHVGVLFSDSLSAELRLPPAHFDVSALLLMAAEVLRAACPTLVCRQRTQLSVFPLYLSIYWPAFMPAIAEVIYFKRRLVTSIGICALIVVCTAPKIADASMNIAPVGVDFNVVARES
jgi:hypothetical protein